MDRFWIILAAGLVGLILLEIGLRVLCGFGNPTLYTADKQIGYLMAPNQEIRRLGKRIAINQYSMRSSTITAARPDNTLRILMLGDSIINGGWWTDQTATIPALLQHQLQRPEYAQVEVLNASANSWSPRNQLAYLQRFGSLQSQVVVLVINTDDLFGTAPTSVVVGRDRNYPDRQPFLAITEVITRYLLPAKPIPELAAVQAEAGDRVGFNLEAIWQIRAIAQQNNAKFLLLITPLLRELQAGPRDYEQKARRRLEEFTQAEAIPLVDFLLLWQSLPQPKSLYLDSIHLNGSGNQQVVQQLIEQVERILDHEMHS
jgi:lysophospholipase L1-like esterase